MTKQPAFQLASLKQGACRQRPPWERKVTSYNYNTSHKKSYKYMLDTYIISLLDIYKDTIDIVEKGIGIN